MNPLSIALFILAVLVASYLVGSIPTGVIIGKTQGIDIRDYGSHNAGGTNVGRVLGKKLGILCIILDMLKCILPMVAALLIFSLTPLLASAGDQKEFYTELLVDLVAVGVCIGHTYPLFAGFKGGKCVACFAGFIIFISPWLFLFGACMFFLLLKITKKVSICSISTVPAVWLVSLVPMILHFTVLPTGYNGGVYFSPDAYIHMTYISSIVILVLAALVVIRHKSNIERIKAGKEPVTHFRTKEEVNEEKKEWAKEKEAQSEESHRENKA